MISSSVYLYYTKLLLTLPANRFYSVETQKQKLEKNFGIDLQL